MTIEELKKLTEEKFQERNKEGKDWNDGFICGYIKAWYFLQNTLMSW